MEDVLTEKLSRAINDKKINKTAYDEILRWLTRDEFSEFKKILEGKILGDEWDFLLDAFYRTVIFATAGFRGVMDIGTNRINNHTVRLASQAYAQYLIKYKKEIFKRGVAIAYDSRINSEQFMKETARVLAAHGLPVFIFKYYRPVPELSFVVRHLALAGGIVITASHNPPEFNGYKVYDERGVQILPDVAIEVEKEFKNITHIRKVDFDDAVASGTISYIGDDVENLFMASAKTVSAYSGRNTNIVYSPLHGVGSQTILPLLKDIGFKNIFTVEEQMSLDGAFPNVPHHFPNPEFSFVYEKSIELAKKVGGNIILVSDPDGDRLGLAIPDAKGNWKNLSGNQSAALLGYFYLYILRKSGRLPKYPVIIKTSVTTDLIRDIAKDFGTEVIGDLLVGFKFVGDRMEHLPKEKTFVFACEESVGYLFNPSYRDKGAETPAIIATEMSAWCNDNAITPSDLLHSIYEKYGYYSERLYYRVIEGAAAFEKMQSAMETLRKNMPKEIGGKKVLKILDRMNGEVRDGQTNALIETRDWDRGDMLSFFFSEDERNVIHVRPSGTEPKMKYYSTIHALLSEKTEKDADNEARILERDITDIFEKILSSVTVDIFG